MLNYLDNLRHNLSIFTHMENNNKDIRHQLNGLTLDELKNYLVAVGEPKFRGEQIFNWIYNHLVMDFSKMQNLPRQLREKLSESCSLQTLELIGVQNSVSTGTKKFLFNTSDNKKIESVIIPEAGRGTLCISTQVGCPLDCKFCATGLMGFMRNLTVGEIVEQYLYAARDYGKERITNIVYMGMGEPLLNYKNMLASLEIFTHELTKGVSRNRTTVSTAGIAPQIIELANSPLRVKLAFSLHSCFEDIRSKIMPINKRYPLKENIDALQYYADKTGKRITFEYTMLKDINDRHEDIRALTKLCKEIPSKLNIIPFNSIARMVPDGISSELEPTSNNKIMDFVERLRNNNITVMIRQTFGDDIAAACGQLAIKS
ncbi:MAG: 23S rRNA (adenine(2503)-C(2))-methyltransferase RlmN [Ignavibacteria bacterium]